MLSSITQTILEDCHNGAVLPGVQAAQKALLAHEQELLDGRDPLEVLAEVRQPFVVAWEQAIKEKGQYSEEATKLLDAMNYLKWE